MLGRLRRHPTTCLDNLILDDVNLMTAELRLYAAAGGKTVVDLTCRGPRVHLGALPLLAQQTGLNIIIGTGLCAPAYYPDTMGVETADSLADGFTLKMERGIGESGIHAGIIGKLVIEEPTDEQQAKVTRAGARASMRTGAALAIDCEPWAAFDGVHRILQEEGISPTRVMLCGMDRAMPTDERRRAADAGYYLLFDHFGQEWYVRGGESRLPRDPERLRELKGLVDQGHLHQLLISQGINRKMLLTRYGGWGYAHIIKNILPWMMHERFSPKQITTITMYNPARALAYLSGG